MRQLFKRMLLLSTLLIFSSISLKGYEVQLPDNHTIRLEQQAHRILPLNYRLTSNAMPDSQTFEAMEPLTFSSNDETIEISGIMTAKVLFLRAVITGEKPSGALSFMIDPGCRLRNFIFFAVSADNVLTDGKMWSQLWNSTAKSEVSQLSADRWQIKLSIPLNNLLLSTSELNGALLGLNVLRITPEKAEKVMAMCGSVSSFLQPTEFITLIAGNPQTTVSVRARRTRLTIAHSTATSVVVDMLSGDNNVRTELPMQNGKAVYQLNLEQFSNYGKLIIRLFQDKELTAVRTYSLQKYFNPTGNKVGKRIFESDQAIVWSLPGVEKPLPHKGIPTASASSVALSCAGNESEGVHIIFSPRDNGLQGKITLSDFSDDTGQMLPSDVFKLFSVENVSVVTPSDHFGYTALWPDPLVPSDGTIDISGENSKTFYLQASIPAGTPSGLYHGILTYQSNQGDQSFSLPIEITVFDFSLPESTAFPAIFSMTNEIGEFMGAQTPEDFARYREAAFSLLRNYRISPDNPMQALSPKEENGAVDYSTWQAAAQTHFNTNHFSFWNLGNGVMVPTLPFHPGNYSPEQQAARQTAFRTFLQWATENGFFPYCYFRDSIEFSKSIAPALAKYYATVKEALPGIKIITAFPGAGEFFQEGNPGAYAVYLSKLTPEFVQTLADNNSELFFRLGPTNRYPCLSDNIDAPGLLIRLRAILGNRYHAKGMLGTSFDALGKLPGGLLRNPWRQTMPYDLDAMLLSNGDGLLFYPENRTRATVAPEKFELYPSLRMELLRDGAEDFEYLAIAKKLLASPELTDHEELNNELSAAVSSWEKMISTPTNFSCNVTTFLENRDTLAKAIGHTLKELENK